MISLLILVFIGKWFYDLAKTHGKSKWLYTFLGIVSFFFSAFIGGALISIAFEVLGIVNIDDINDYLLGLISLFLGISGCWVFRNILQKSWKKEQDKMDPDVLDDLL